MFGIPLDLCTLAENTRVLLYSLEWKSFFVVKGFLSFFIIVARTIFSSLVHKTLLWMSPSSWVEEFFLKILVSVSKHSLVVFNRMIMEMRLSLTKIKYDMIGLCLIVLEFDSSFFGGMLLYHFVYITIKVMLFKNIQHPFLPCVEVGSTFKAIFWLNEDRCHGCNIFLNSSRST